MLATRLRLEGEGTLTVALPPVTDRAVGTTFATAWFDCTVMVTVMGEPTAWVTGLAVIVLEVEGRAVEV